jgi:hypothetical protein
MKNAIKINGKNVVHLYFTHQDEEEAMKKIGLIKPSGVQQ